MRQKTLKKIAAALGIVLVLLWFGANLYLYYYTNKIMKTSCGDTANKIPQEIVLKGDMEVVEPLPVMGLRLKLPVKKESFEKVLPMFLLKERLDHVTIYFKNRDSTLIFMIERYGDAFNDKAKLTTARKFWQKLFGYRSFSSNYGLVEVIEHARLSDYSWWNLPGNWELGGYLLLKCNSRYLYDGSAYDEYAVHEVKSRNTSGILREGIAERYSEPKSTSLTHYLSEYYFYDRGSSYTVSLVGAYSGSAEDKINNGFRDMVASIASIEDSRKGLRELEAFSGKGTYPAELLIISEISLDGPSMDNMGRLLKVMEDRNYPEYIIKEVRKELQNLAGRQG